MIKGQLLRFGIIGCTAMGIHWVTVVYIVTMWNIPPLIANILGFLVAFQVSYWGHYKWTFEATHLAHKAAIVRFLATACSGFLLSEFLYAFILHIFPFSYKASLIVALLLTAAFTFIVSKVWAFR